MKTMNKTLPKLLTGTGAAILALALASCSTPLSDLGGTAEGGDSRTASTTTPTTATSLSTVETLFAGQTIDAGTLTISRDETTLYIVYATNASYAIGETHLWVGTSITDVPQNRQGIVVPGQFPYVSSYSPAVNTATVQVPISWADGSTLFIFAHAALEGTNSSIQSQTAFAGTNVYASNRWTYYVEYTLPAYAVADRTISGFAYFDANGNGQKDADEPGIPDVGVTLTGASVSASAFTAADGSYGFTDLSAATYAVSAADETGFSHTSDASLSVDSTDNPANVNFGYGLDAAWITAQNANGFTIGYWKTNIDKAITGTTKGTQVSASTLAAYTASLSNFAIEPLNPTSLAAASAILSSTSSDPSALLAKQLMGSEYNYANGAYFSGFGRPTYYFVYLGEYILKHSADYTSQEILAAKDLYDAYNNTHGGSMTTAIGGI